MRNIDLAAVEKFFTQSLPITGNINIEPKMRVSLADIMPRPFMEESNLGITIKVNRDGAAVMKGDQLVGSIGRLNELVILKDYRGKGIAPALITAWAEANPWYIPLGQMPRTAAGAAAYRKAWQQSLQQFYTAMTTPSTTST
jgi:GNAT superfamily N-acetyltransferase